MFYLLFEEILASIDHTVAVDSARIDGRPNAKRIARSVIQWGVSWVSCVGSIVWRVRRIRKRGLK